MHRFMPKRSERPRELRRRVVIPARLRTGSRWNDICILNISSRGLMIHSPRPSNEGSVVELRRGDHVIVARVVWRDGARVGLRSDERLPVDQILSAAQSDALQLTAARETTGERRKRPRRRHDDARLRGRALEFVGVGMIAASLAVTTWGMAQEAFARPMHAVVAALGG
jgi:hypothetical protein